MSCLTFEQFQSAAAAYNVVPLCREFLADLETPISLALKLNRGESRFFLLESVEGGEQWGRYSILGFDIKEVITIQDGRAWITDITGKETHLSGNPVTALQTWLQQFRMAPIAGLPRFSGGIAGYFSFAAVQYFERCGEVKDNLTGFPEACFFITDRIAVFDNVNKTIKLINCVHVNSHTDLRASYEEGKEVLIGLEKILLAESPLTAISNLSVPSGSEAHSSANKQRVELIPNMTRADYEAKVEIAKEYIRNGDIFQVVLAQHFQTRIAVAPLDVYRALRHINPSPYLYFFKINQHRAIAGSSPEVMVQVTGKNAVIRPIAGTRPRGVNPEDDERLKSELLADLKEQAEHVMLVDLARNDLGRIAVIGSVRVTDYMIVEKYSHVMHMVSQVEAQVRDELDAIDVFKATFPAGTLSGAPKVRAMEIINELEPHGRGPYGGAIGYISYGGTIMDMAITIRSVICKNSEATVTVGAGIVQDSVKEREYEETVHKSNGMRRALELAENGLRLDC